MRAAFAESGFHAGELSVQRRAGVSRDAARLEGMLAPARLDGGAAKFLAQRQFAVLTGRDEHARLWTSPLLGPAGFLDAAGTTLRVHAAPAPGDPLHELPVGQPLGLLSIEFANRRRVRVNGTLTSSQDGELSIEADQAYGNCPSYIQQRSLDVGRSADGTAVSTAPAEQASGLDPAQRALIERADTFFLGTEHPSRGADASHKGGRPGFVRIDEAGDLWWPDYAGNNMFNSMGNLVVNPEASLLFIDFATGATLQLSGTAELQWTEIGVPGDDGNTGRRIHFHPAVVTTAVRLPIHAGAPDPSPHNPAVH